jgi:DNA-binding CsgD family transcriptional regulator
MHPASGQEARTFRSVKRICYAGLDSIRLRVEVGERIAGIVPVDAWAMATVDPDTALFTHAVAEGVPSSLSGAWVQRLHLLEEAESIIRQRRTGEPVTTESSGRTTALLRASGFRHELRTVLATRAGLWGFSCMLRRGDGARFGAFEQRFMRRVAPHIAAGLRSAALLGEAAALAPDGAVAQPSPGGSVAQPSPGGSVAQPSPDGSAPPPSPGGSVADGVVRLVPGVIVLDGRAQIRLRNGPAATCLADLADVGMAADAVPSAVAATVARLLALHETGAAPGQALSSQLRARGQSGRWYTLEASLSEPGTSGESSVILLMRPAGRADIALLLARLYGLTPRERETVARVARGESTKQIASGLGISPYTVQEHVGKACEKVGVRTRKALLARLFFDGYAAAIVAGEDVGRAVSQ